MKVDTIICADCLEVMKDWPKDSMALVCTDPPMETKK
ncbi:MAG TPA: site-specific DNA-methyltransferase [bacterium]|nr:site-specific DNA-methyltransferase [bacterium]